MHVGDDKVPGLVALVARGDQVHVEALGALAVGGPPVRRDSLFRLSSTTKPITGAATLTLVGEGLLGPDEPVDRWLPELAHPGVLAQDGRPAGRDRPGRASDHRARPAHIHLRLRMLMDMFTAREPWPVVAAANELRLATFGPPNPAAQPDADTWIAALGSSWLVDPSSS